MGKYDDIIGLEHPQSAKYPPMPMQDRAAQFAPFAVLNGLEDVLHRAEQEAQTNENSRQTAPDDKR